MSVKWYFSISTACRILNSPIIAEAFHSLSINFFTIDDIRVGANLKTKKTDKTKEEYARASYGRIPFNLEEKKLNTLHGKTFPRISSIFWFNGSSESWHVSFDFFFFLLNRPHGCSAFFIHTSRLSMQRVPIVGNTFKWPFRRYFHPVCFPWYFYLDLSNVHGK